MNKKLVKKLVIFTLLFTAKTINIFVFKPQIVKSQVQNTTLSSQQIRQKIEKVTVQIEGSIEEGTGTIIDKQNNLYLVLTNRHVVEKIGDEYKVITADKKIHNVIQIKRIEGTDLAFIYFISDIYYQNTSKGNSRKLNLEDRIHLGGYPASNKHISERNFHFYPNGKITNFKLGNEIDEEGYAIEMNIEALKGLSGSGVFNNKLQLIGVYGRGKSHLGKILTLAIPIDTAVDLALKNQIRIISWRVKFSNVNSANQYKNSGHAYGIKGDFNRAIIDLTQAIKLDSNYAEAYFLRGVAYGIKKDFGQAIEDLTQAIALESDDPFYYNYRALAYFKKKEYDLAIADVNKTLKLNPNFAEAYLIRNQAYIFKDEPKKAQNDLFKALKLNNNLFEISSDSTATKNTIRGTNGWVYSE